jgi:hypothetical protein
VKPSLSLDANKAPTLHAICNRLDRLPLAIELAAARLKLFTPEALLARLEKMPLDVLTNGASDLPARQHTLRTTIDWSYGLLNPNEQMMFRKLGVFAGGFTLESAELVAGADWETLSSLLDKSLIQNAGEVNGEPRFTLLELLREYALEKLEACGEGEATRRKHAQFVVAQAEAAEPHMLTGEQVRWTRRLNSELGNLRAALRWAQERNAYESTMRIMGPTWRYWQTQTLPPEGLAWILPALHDDPNIPAVVRAKAWHVAGAMTMSTSNDCKAGKPLHEKGLALAEEAGDHDVLSLTLNGTSAANHEVDSARSKQLAARALKHTEGEVSYGRAGALLFYAMALFVEKRDYQIGLEMTSEAQRILHILGDYNWEMRSLNFVADFADLLRYFRLGVQCRRDILRIALRLGLNCIELDSPCTAIYNLALYAGQCRQATTMARLYSAANSGMLLMGHINPDTDLPDVKRQYIEYTGEPPDNVAFAQAWAEGRALTLQQAIDYALEVADELLRLEEDAVK